ncbi:uncharacterized protein EI90DRAFT_3017948 [Cantharellus anzutake]|uniref:uncharacterized protein n=1 Tax=Cantharellus anzutake TaxID=1750568 RepID=UPI001902F7EA|nr:uncharacterized protein EI90DRAFT_3017948 [Cantharellus anzutake]KAF8327960.1 hypothetical protein EI90DRAFT_3017948 [Cantharellus anzutake]
MAAPVFILMLERARSCSCPACWRSGDKEGPSWYFPPLARKQPSVALTSARRRLGRGGGVGRGAWDVLQHLEVTSRPTFKLHERPRKLFDGYPIRTMSGLRPLIWHGSREFKATKSGAEQDPDPSELDDGQSWWDESTNTEERGLSADLNAPKLW